MLSSLRNFVFTGLVLLAGCKALTPPETSPTGSRVTVESTTNGFALHYNGQPYFIKGAGGRMHLEQVAPAGGNSIRTWSTEKLGEILDEAQRLGLTVTAGFWMGHERHGFDYSDAAMVKAQFEKAREAVLAHRNHPALLIWAVGNEMEWHPGTNEQIYKSVNDVARMIKELDPHHPTMTVLGGVGEGGIKAQYVMKYCPDVDILGINDYGGAKGIPVNLEEAGFTKPFIVTEFGPMGPWECAKAPWGAEFENDGDEKGQFYLETYREAVESAPGRCLGSYVFNWGQKQEVTPTWFGMFLKDGSRLNPVDYITYAWTGAWPSNRCPVIGNFRSALKGAKVPGGKEYDVIVTATDPDGDTLKFTIEILGESNDRRHGGDAESVPESFSDAIVRHEGNRFVIRTPPKSGAYRLFAYVHDGQGNATSINSPFYVQ